MTNLNEDPVLSYVICHFLGSKKTLIGRSPDCEIKINGLSIIAEHGIITNEKGKIYISPMQRGAKIRVNGMNVEDPKELQHKDRILIGIKNKNITLTTLIINKNMS